MSQKYMSEDMRIMPLVSKCGIVQESTTSPSERFFEA